MPSKNIPFPIILTAPSGTGKTTIRKALIEQLKNLKYSVSATTRLPREGEIEGKDYYFISYDTFKERINQNKLCEWAEVYGNLYGTPKEPLEEFLKDGYKVILTLDVQGARKMKSLYPDSVGIFILPPSFEELKNRLIGRDKNMSENLKKRLNLAKIELDYLKEFDYAIVNENVNNSVEKIAVIITAEEYKVKRQEKIYEKK